MGGQSESQFLVWLKLHLLFLRSEKYDKFDFRIALNLFWLTTWTWTRIFPSTGIMFKLASLRSPSSLPLVGLNWKYHQSVRKINILTAIGGFYQLSVLPIQRAQSRPKCEIIVIVQGTATLQPGRSAVDCSASSLGLSGFHLCFVSSLTLVASWLASFRSPPSSSSPLMHSHYHLWGFSILGDVMASLL